MKSLPAKKAYLLIYFCSVCSTLSAQPGLSKFELGANAITFIYQGDLTPSKSGSFKTIGLGLGIYGNYKLNNAFYLKTSLAFGNLKGDDSKYKAPAWRQQRNFKFKSSVTEISESVVWNILRTANKEGQRLSPYISAGVGYTFLNIKRDYSNYNAAYFEGSAISAGLSTDFAHSLPKGLLVFPVGFGVRYSLTENISLNAESSYRLHSTDYLDGYSEAANPAKKDHYFSNAVGLIYGFGRDNRLKCPRIRY
jgi:opacity protein-like surface antigen